MKISELQDIIATALSRDNITPDSPVHFAFGAVENNKPLILDQAGDIIGRTSDGVDTPTLFFELIPTEEAAKRTMVELLTRVINGKTDTEEETDDLSKMEVKGHA